VHEWFRKIIPGLRGADPKVEVMIANSLWAGGDVKGEFSEVCKEVFLSDVYPLGPGAASQINSWVSEKTRGKIQKLVETDPLGPAVLLNAVYFKGEWSSTFEGKLTQDGTFNSFAGAVPCHYMHKNEKRMLFGETPGAQLVMLPYGEAKRVGAFVVLPTRPGKAGLAAAVEQLFGSDSAWDQAVDVMGHRPVKLYLPRFKVEYGVKSLKSALADMGMHDAFQASAQFHRMTEGSAYIEDVLHKAVIEVNEEGTVAAAATAVMMTRSLPPPPVELKVDRPFLFVVYDQPAKTVLFAAKIESV